jgi:hypothetical protein
MVGRLHALRRCFSIECQNGPATSRGLYVDQGTLMYVTRHNKSRGSTNQEFQVARYLPPGVAELVAAYVVYVRPFANMLCRTCYGSEDERRLLFASWDRPRIPWIAAFLTCPSKQKDCLKNLLWARLVLTSSAALA